MDDCTKTKARPTNGGGEGNLSESKRDSGMKVDNLGGSRFDILRENRDMEENLSETNVQPRGPVKEVTNTVRMRNIPQNRKANPKSLKPSNKHVRMMGREEIVESPMEVLERAKQRLNGPSATNEEEVIVMDTDMQSPQKAETEVLATTVPNSLQTKYEGHISNEPPDLNRTSLSQKSPPDPTQAARLCGHGHNSDGVTCEVCALGNAMHT